MKIEPINFLNIGYTVTVPNPRFQPHQGGLNLSAQLHNQFLLEKKMIFEQRAPLIYDACQKVLDKLLPGAGIPKKLIGLKLIRADEPNAFILPQTREFFVFSSLLEKKNDLTEGNLAGILGHELGHLLRFSHNPSIPDRFKNPLYRQYVLGSSRAFQQKEEYLGDELGLIIVDAAGYSVEEALDIAGWFSSFESEKSPVAKQHILTPASIHPHIGTRVGIIRDLIDDQRFEWKNRAVKSTFLLTPELKAQLSDDSNVSPLKKHRIFRRIAKIDKKHKKLAPFEISAVNWIAKNAKLDIKHPIFDCFAFLNQCGRRFSNLDESDRNQLKNLFLALRKNIEHGDFLSHAYQQAVLAQLYISATKNKTAEDLLKWLENDCAVNTEETMTAVLQFLEEANAKTILALKEISKKTKPAENEYEVFEQMAEISESEETEILKHASLDLILEETILPLPCCDLRDGIIAALLRNFYLLDDRENYLDAEVLHLTIIPGELKLSHLSPNGAVKILPLLHGARGIFLDYFEDILSSLNNKEAKDIANDLDTALSLSSLKESSEIHLALAAGAPFDRERIESLLTIDLKLLQEFISPIIRKSLGDLKKIYHKILQQAEKMNTDGARKRLEHLARIIVMRYLDALPVDEWVSDAFEIVDLLPKSNEKNYLLILLAKERKRNVSMEELIFEEIPDPDADLGQGQLTFLNALGFNNQESIYPSGQRVLDRWIAENLPQSGLLDLSEIVRNIPRPSPGRDELLDRTVVNTRQNAREILDAYWSPVSAYTKAYNIASHWLDNSSGDIETFNNVCEITAEFPSLKRRMVNLWANKFGISAENYKPVVDILSAADVIDFYKGAMIEAGSKIQTISKVKVCVATLATALERSGFSLLNLSAASEKNSVFFDEFPQGDEEQSEEKSREAKFFKIGVLSKNDIEQSKTKDREEEKTKALMKLYEDYAPFLPEKAVWIADCLWNLENELLIIDAVPFVDDKPMPDARFKRLELLENAVAEMKKWELGKNFFNFMKAMGGEEVVVFYENMFLGKDGIIEYPREFEKLENVFIKAIGILLQEKNVPLRRLNTVQENLKQLMIRLPFEVRGKIWARILAGIAQQQDISEITRQAVRPLQSAGGKLMQAVHSMTAGVDAVLEDATRKALDQTAGFSLLDSLQALGWRLDGSPFLRHQKYYFLGSGTVRTGIAGIDGGNIDEAFILTHGRPTDVRVTEGIIDFIRSLERSGEPFPLAAQQFRSLVLQAEEERRQGLQKHQEYGEAYNWQLANGIVKIPKVYLNYGSWGSLELIHGATYQNLPPERKKQTAPIILSAIISQGELFNPDFHAGNIIVNPDGTPYLLDCGLTGVVTPADKLALFSIFASLRNFGLAGAAAAFLNLSGKTSLKEMKNSVKDLLIGQIKIVEGQIKSGIPAELLLSALNSITRSAGGFSATSGLDLLFRAVQHAGPYIRDAGDFAEQNLSIFPVPEEVVFLAREIEAQMAKNDAPKQREIIPKGTAVGKRISSGKLQALGVLKDEGLIMGASSGFTAGLVKCVLEKSTEYIRPEDLFVQTGKGKWLVFDEWKKVNSW
jgi:hypothetical protein